MSRSTLARPPLRVETYGLAVVALPKGEPTVDVSRMIRDLSALMTIYVVFLHSQVSNLPPAEGASSFLDGLQAFVQNSASALRVPLFFMFSGWLFFRRAASPADCLRKIPSRLRSLGLPYLLWTLPFALWGAAASGRLADLPRLVFLDPPNYPLWFLRNLLTVVFLTPALHPILRRRDTGAALLVALGAWHALGGLPDAWQGFLRLPALLFFGLGGYAAIHEIPVPRLSPRATRIALPAYLAAVGADFALTRMGSPLGMPLAHGLMLCGCVVVLSAYRPEWRVFETPLVGAVRSAGFFVYIGHEPLLTGVRTAILAVTGSSSPALAAQFFLAPLATIALLLGAARLLQRRAPRLYALLTGDRHSASKAMERPRLVLVEGGLSSQEPTSLGRTAA